MNIVFQRMTKEGWDWFNSKVPVLCVEDSCGMVARDASTDAIVGGCVLDNWTDTSVMVHFAVSSPMVLRAGFFDLCADFVFNDRKRRIVYATVPDMYASALGFLPKVGFTEVARLKDAFKEGIDCVIMELRKENLVHISKEAA